MLGVGADEPWTAGLISGEVTLILGVKWRDFLAHSFDPVQALMIGLRTGWLHYGLLAILSATIVAMLSSVGIILSVAYLIAPGAIGFLLTRRFSTMLMTSAAVALVAGLAGIYASFGLDAAPAPTIVLILTGLFLGALAVRQLRERRAGQSA